MSCQRALQIDPVEYLVAPDLPAWVSFRNHYPGCSDCSEQVAAWTRLEQGLRTPPAGHTASRGTTHPKPRTLARYAEAPGSLGTEAAVVEAHLETCQTCETELLALRAFDFGSIAAPTSPAEVTHDRDRNGFGARVAAWLGLDSLSPGSLGAALPIAVAVAIVCGVGIWVGLRTLPGPGVDARSGNSLAEATTAAEGTPGPEGSAVLPGDDTREGREELRLAAEPEGSASEGTAEADLAPPDAATERVALAEAVTEPAPRAEQPARVSAETSQPQSAPDAVTAPDRQAAPEVPTESVAPQAEILLAAVANLPPPSYTLPPGAEALGWQREFGAVRAPNGVAGAAVEVQAPRHVGQTAMAAPRLWWSLDAATARTLVFTLSDDREIDPVLRVELPGEHAGGLDSIDLARFAIELEPGVVYRWFVTVEVDPDHPSRNPISAGAVERVRPGDPRLAGLNDVPGARRGHEAAERGLWYDAFDFFAALAEAHPEMPELEAHRTVLLKLAHASD